VGTTMVAMMRPSDAPSIMADSSISTGTASMKP
jgi:hypothetical protein